MISVSTSLLVLINWSESVCEIPDCYPSLPVCFVGVWFHSLDEFYLCPIAMSADAVLIGGPEMK